MRSRNYSMLLESLASKISDYGEEEILTISPLHIERWLKQFDVSDQIVILAEMNFLMQKFYFSKYLIKSNLTEFIKDIVGAKRPQEVLPYIRFLRIQKTGSSQDSMLQLVDEVLREEYGSSISMTGNKNIKTYIYVDDCIYTGNKLRYDLTDGRFTTGWLSHTPASNCELLIYAPAIHTLGVNYAYKYIEKNALEKNIKTKVFTAMQIKNGGNNLEVLKPSKLVVNDFISSYIEEMRDSSAYSFNDDDLFRPQLEEEEHIFSSPQARSTVEKAFLIKGIQLIQACKDPLPSMRPLGFKVLPSLGFGSLFVPYRNISNCCPLVLWWGDPSLPSSSPLARWYPLFPRITNRRRVIMSEEQTFDEFSF